MHNHVNTFPNCESALLIRLLGAWRCRAAPCLETLLMCVDCFCTATLVSVGLEEPVQEVSEECVVGYFENDEKTIQRGYTKAIPAKDHSAGKCFQSTRLRSVKEAYYLMHLVVWMQPFDVSCYIKWHWNSSVWVMKTAPASPPRSPPCNITLNVAAKSERGTN